MLAWSVVERWDCLDERFLPHQRAGETLPRPDHPRQREANVHLQPSETLNGASRWYNGRLRVHFGQDGGKLDRVKVALHDEAFNLALELRLPFTEGRAFACRYQIHINAAGKGVDGIGEEGFPHQANGLVHVADLDGLGEPKVRTISVEGDGYLILA